MIFLYRISSNSNKKEKLVNGDKQKCFINFTHNVLDEKSVLIVLADNVDRDLERFLVRNIPSNGKLLYINAGSNAASFRMQLNIASKLPASEIVFLHEDDYLYDPPKKLDNADKFCNLLIREGLARSEYVSLYDHPDKYRPPSRRGNPFITEDGVENTGVFLTNSSHWKYTNSTTGTFAVKVRTLLEDLDVWYKWSAGPDDFRAFLDLRARGRRVATPIPGCATHCEVGALSPLKNWDLV